jgi:hypothetical protein
MKIAGNVLAVPIVKFIGMSLGPALWSVTGIRINILFILIK